MQGFITDRDFAVIEEYFPGIRRFYLKSQPKPITFLELVWRFQVERSRAPQAPPAGDSGRRRRTA